MVRVGEVPMVHRVLEPLVPLPALLFHHLLVFPEGLRDQVLVFDDLHGEARGRMEGDMAVDDPRTWSGWSVRYAMPRREGLPGLSALKAMMRYPDAGSRATSRRGGLSHWMPLPLQLSSVTFGSHGSLDCFRRAKS